MSKIEYKCGDILGDYGAIFLEEIAPHVAPTRTYRKAKFKCGFYGKIFEAVINDVKRNNPKSCGCYRKISKAKTHLKDISGEKRGLLTAIQRLDKQASDNSYYWLCKCDCGNLTEIPICDFGKTKSCGCLSFHSYGEQCIAELLDKYNILYETQKTFNDYKSSKNALLKFDFYLPEQQICIEIDGRQHHEPVSHFGGEKAFQELQKNDIIKNKYCNQSNIKMVRIDYDGRKFNIEKALDVLCQEGIIEYN